MEESENFTPLKFSLALRHESLLLLALFHAPVAQLDRASDYGSEGLGFDSLRVRHFRSRGILTGRLGGKSARIPPDLRGDFRLPIASCRLGQAAWTGEAPRWGPALQPTAFARRTCPPLLRTAGKPWSGRISAVCSGWDYGVPLQSGRGTARTLIFLKAAESSIARARVCLASDQIGVVEPSPCRMRRLSR